MATPQLRGPLMNVTPQPCTVLGVTRDLRTPYVSSWMADVQQRASPTIFHSTWPMSATVPSELLGLSDMNQPQPSDSARLGQSCRRWQSRRMCLASAHTLATTTATPIADCRSRLPSRSLRSSRTWAMSNMLEQQLSPPTTHCRSPLTQRTSHGLSFVLGYTYSTRSRHWVRQLEFPRSHQQLQPQASSTGPRCSTILTYFTYSVTYVIPGKKTRAQLLDGWSVNSIVTIQSGAAVGNE